MNGGGIYPAVSTALPFHWREISREPTRARPTLLGEATADLVVIGGGFTGLAAALAAAQAGQRVVLLEQDGIGSAASGRSNGQIIPHHCSHTPREIEALLGPVRGARYNAMVAGGAGKVFDFVARYSIACDAIQAGWIQASHAPSRIPRLRHYCDEWRALGARVEWLDREVMISRTGSRIYPAGWQAAEGGHLNPYALAQGLARAAEEAGVDIFTNSPAVALRPEGKRWCVDTPGGVIISDQVLIATNAHTGALWPELAKAVIPVRVYQVTTAPLDTAQRRRILSGNQAMSDTRHDIRAFRYDSDGRLATVGAHILWHRSQERAFKSRQRMLCATFPELGPIEISAYWEGVIGVVPEHLPRLFRLARGVFFAGIYSGRGIALGSALGETVGRWLSGSIQEADLPIPMMEGIHSIPFNGLAIQARKLIQPLRRLQDWPRGIGKWRGSDRVGDLIS